MKPRGRQRSARTAFLGVFLSLATASSSLGEPAPARMVTVDEALTWRAIGKLNVAGNRFCSAVLVTDLLVMTAAHCMFNFRTGHFAHPEDVKFIAGQWRDTYAALRGVDAVSVSPDFRPKLGIRGEPQDSDIALLRLDQPIPSDVARPIPVDDRRADSGLAVIGYGQDRAYVLSVRSDCSVTSSIGAVFEMDCLVVPGLSGAPVIAMRTDGPRTIGVVSQKIGRPADPASPALAVEASPRYQELKAALPAP